MSYSTSFPFSTQFYLLTICWYLSPILLSLCCSSWPTAPCTDHCGLSRCLAYQQWIVSYASWQLRRPVIWQWLNVWDPFTGCPIIFSWSAVINYMNWAGKVYETPYTKNYEIKSLGCLRFKGDSDPSWERFWNTNELGWHQILYQTNPLIMQIHDNSSFSMTCQRIPS